MNNNFDTAYFAGGCFWCTEAIFKKIKGVINVIPGYTGGTVNNPNYSIVSKGYTDHAEAVKITYDSKIIKYDHLLNIFFSTHDPTTINRQGNDVGSHYRSAIFYVNSKQLQSINNFLNKLKNQKKFNKDIVTQISKFSKFYSAEVEHVNYYELNKFQPYCNFVIKPKVDKFNNEFKEYLD